jgi:hypothetical protein|tara:strand:- start:2855 stop:3205 length:351 start_codon:yes stop_codon:yes gene_type:complete
MESIIQSFGTELYRDRNHVGYKVLVKHMIPLWKKWSKNRDPDMERVNEIVECGVYIPKFIHLAELEGEGHMCKSHGTYKPVVIEKCKKHGLWLFLEREVSPEHVERLMHKKKFGIF